MLQKEKIPQLVPENQFPEQALDESVQVPPKQGNILGQAGWVLTWNIASASDAIMPWGRDVRRRDQQLRDFWPTETYLAGAMASIAFRNATLDWEIQGPTKVVEAVTDMINAAIAGDSFGYVKFQLKFSQDLYTQDNGAFIELIRDPGMDGNSKFKNERAPVIGIASIDSNQCVRTGIPETPVYYTDRDGKIHLLKWYQIIPFSDFPSAIEKMNGVGYCAVSRALRMAQIARSIAIYKDEKISGRHIKQIHFVSGVSRQDIKDEMTRTQEEGNNAGLIRYLGPSILASLDPEKPVSTATIDLAALPDGFDFDVDMKWYIAGLALAIGTDYQELAPLPGGQIGSASQSMILHRKSSGKSPAVFMRTFAESLRNYGVLPRGCKMIFNDKNEQEELERQEVRTKAMEEMAIAVNAKILTPEAAAKDLVRRGIYDEETISLIAPDWWTKAEEAINPKNLDRGGNTVAEDARRQENGKQKLTAGARLRKLLGGE